MATLKERLAAAPDLLQKTIPVTGLGEVTIRRLTVRERDEVLKDQKQFNGDDTAKGSAVSCRVVAAALVEPKTTMEELIDMPATIVEEIAMAIMHFNGWTDQGRRALEDQFRAST